MDNKYAMEEQMMWKKEIIYHAARPLVYYLTKEDGRLFLNHNYAEKKDELVTQDCFLLPSDHDEENKAYRISAARPFRVALPDSGDRIEIAGEGEKEEIMITSFAGVPHCDIMGNSMELTFRNGQEMEETAYQFYWRTLLPSVVERTVVSGYRGCDGYVVSTLQLSKYAGTYPDVDHEFQIKGRIAVGSGFELSLVRRMLELQLKLMEEDPQQLYRDPCALQPDGTREYHVRRNSMDGRTNAVMFLVTGNIEIVEETCLYLEASGDWSFWKQYKKRLEKAFWPVEECVDHLGRLWSDVYYEDQVIKDGRECMSAALAADAARRMAFLEERAGDEKMRQHYLALEQRLAEAMVRPLPAGFWDEQKQRFTDWVDRSGVSHDHIHLLANGLPVLFGYADERQCKAVRQMMAENFEAFQRFPSFVAARVEDYTDSEIGDGGPYDLCAAGRYWCWDFAFWKKEGRKDILEKQLLAVCRQAKADGYLMGERYDMNYAYYQSEKNWHGAAHYYEYPCVFWWNLVQGYLGIRKETEDDLRIEPMLNQEGLVCLKGDAYGVSYEIRGDEFTVANLLEKERTFLLIYEGQERQITLAGGAVYDWRQDVTVDESLQDYISGNRLV